MDIEALIVPFLLAGLILAPLEHLHHDRPRITREVARTDLSFALIGGLLVQLGMWLIIGSGLTALYRLARPLHAQLPWFRADGFFHETLMIFAGLMIFEGMGYAYHRLAHASSWLYRFHAVHHSSRSLGWLASFRQHPVETLLMTATQNIPLVLLGLPIGTHTALLLFLKLNTAFVHSNIRLPRGRWERVIASPRFHHAHHDARGNDTNFASLFPWIDLAFGTYSDRSATQLGDGSAPASGFLRLMLFPVTGVRRARRGVDPRGTG